jgi:hypothetical protein
MQAVYSPEGKTQNDSLEGDKSVVPEMLYFVPKGLLPASHTLVLNRKLGTLSYLSKGTDHPRLVMQQQFTTSELSLLLPLLELYPDYCPYEVMFASFYNGTITEETVELCRQRLYEALERGTWDQQLRPLRNVLSRTRMKLRAFGIDISSILETGYILIINAGPDVREIA